MTRNNSIDLLKGLAIICVIILHSLSKELLYDLYAPYYLWQAVPIFMLLFALNNAQSFTSKNKDSLQDLYNSTYFYARLKRIIQPFFIIWLLQIIIELSNRTDFNLSSITKSFLTGGFGPGSYFIPLIIQFVLIVPILFYIAKKAPTMFLITGFIVSLLLEYLYSISFLNDSHYRILFIRYLFAVVLGIWYIVNPSSKLKIIVIVIGTLVSFIYITLVSYYGASLINEPLWRAEHAPAYFWALLIVVLVMKIKLPKTILTDTTVSIGKASMHIFLVQMVYFRLFQLKLINLRAEEFLYTAINIVICCALGILFYKIESKPR